MRLSYDQLVRQYLETLNAKLRHFAVEPEFVATWVYDEDDHRSLYDLFVAAQGGGCRDLTVEVAAPRAVKLDRARLSRELASLGDVSLSPRSDGGLDVGVRLKDKITFEAPSRAAVPGPRVARAARTATTRKEAARPSGIGESYRRAIEGRTMRFEGLSAGAPGQRYAASESGATLEAWVGPDGMVQGARHAGATGPLRAVLDALCEVMEGRPLQEAHDHAVIRVEARLRDRAAAPAVEGLVTPINADSVFASPQRLVRSLYRQFLEQTGEKPSANFWDDSAATAWKELAPDEKLRRARQAVAEGCRVLGLPAQGVEVLEILGGVRFVLAHTPATAKPAFGAPMLGLEGFVKKTLDLRIELQLESLEDRNRRAERTARGDKDL